MTRIKRGSTGTARCALLLPILLAAFSIAGCSGRTTEDGSRTALGWPFGPTRGEQAPTEEATATALYKALHSTPIPRTPLFDPVRPLLDWQLDVDRAPCIGEMMTLRSTLDFALDSRLATELGVTEMRGEMWLEYPGDVLSIVSSKPGPTRVEGHGRPGRPYAVVWEGVVLRAGEVDERALTFRSHGESYGHRGILGYFIREENAEEAIGQDLGPVRMFIQFGNQDEHPEAVRSTGDIGPDRPSRCATPGAGMGVDADVDVESGP